MGKKTLIVVDAQNDFIEGVLGSREAVNIVPKIVDKISKWDGDIILTQDTHAEDYNLTYEGKHIPQHCIENTAGHKLNAYIEEAAWKRAEGNSECNVRMRTKFALGDYYLPDILDDHPECIEIVGLCTDICVMYTALILKAYYPETDIVVDSHCCAGSSHEMHRKALEVMKSCLITVKEY